MSFCMSQNRFPADQYGKASGELKHFPSTLKNNLVKSYLLFKQQNNFMKIKLYFVHKIRKQTLFK